ncbi:MAG: hypothetical protein ACREUC_07555, partial [Steroidobacteraceae bacterium]
MNRLAPEQPGSSINAATSDTKTRAGSFSHAFLFTAAPAVQAIASQAQTVGPFDSLVEHRSARSVGHQSSAGERNGLRNAAVRIQPLHATLESCVVETSHGDRSTTLPTMLALQRRERRSIQIEEIEARRSAATHVLGSL